jgi:prepilin-type N-terminal cleavage/methylation domain-containing protein
MKNFKTNGFTLTELLVGMSILSLLAAFAIPKILTSVETTSNKALFKETLNTIANIAQNGVLTGELTPDDAGEAYMVKTLNARKVCLTGACTDTWLSGTADETLATGAILQNGVELSFIHKAADVQIAYVDLNGSGLPNTVGKDKFYVCYNATQATTNGACGSIKAGMIAPHTGFADNLTGYNSLLF